MTNDNGMSQGVYIWPILFYHFSSYRQRWANSTKELC